jgi:hypothetical protein
MLVHSCTVKNLRSYNRANLAPLGVETGVDVTIVAEATLLVGVARSWLPPGVLKP